MPSLPTKLSKKAQMLTGSISLLLIWAVNFFFGTPPWTLAYGSFLLWALAAGLIWGIKAPFLAVALFLVMSASLSWEVLSTDPWHSIPPDLGLWLLLVFLSSLGSALSLALIKERGRVRQLEKSFQEVARFHVWGRLTVSLGHELRNQIAIVTGYLDQMKDDELSPAQHRKIERSLLANDRMLKLLTQLRLMTRDCLHEPPEPIRLAEVLQEALDFMERPLEYRAVTVRFTAPPGLPTIMGHPNLMQTLIVHLVLRSLDLFKGQNTDKRKEIGIEISQHDEGVALHYRDNAESVKPWDYAGQTLAEQMIERLGGTMDQRPAAGHGWTLALFFRTPHSRHDSSATGAEGYS